MATFTKKFHHNSYPAISPSSPLNSHQGDTILITGSSAGIGLATAKAFIVSGATRVIILSRQQSLLSPALQYLEESRPLDSTTEVLGRQVSITNKESIARLWKDLNTDGINVNILVLNAAKTGHSPILAMGSSNTWEYFETNVLSSLLMTEHFMNQAPEVPKVLINVASFLAHVLPANGSGGYATSKAAGSFMLQTLADETPVSTMQIISLHPGSIFSDAAKAAGYKEDSIPWDNDELPASFIVWASTNQASFLHGRFVWSSWDVVELEGMKEKFKTDPGFLKIGLQGIPTITTEVFNEIREVDKKAVIKQ